MELAAVAMPMKGCGGGYGSKTMEIRWVTKKDNYENNGLSKLKTRRMPIFISTNPSHINLHELRELYTKCNHSCHRFPEIDHNGKVVVAVDLKKLRVALSHSSVLVSVFCNLREDVADNNDPERKKEDFLVSPLMGLGDLFRTVTRLPVVSPPNAHLVGFGRAVSDFGLTASIYDVMVIPSLQRMGIGKMIVKRLIRMLTNRDIYDIAALCSANERLFFKACGFGDDILDSTTMMYTRTVSTCTKGEQMVKCAGRKLLLAPPLRMPSGGSGFQVCKKGRERGKASSNIDVKICAAVEAASKNRKIEKTMDTERG